MKPIGIQGNVMIEVCNNEVYVTEDLDVGSISLGELVSSYIDHGDQFPAYISIDIAPLELGLKEYNPDYFSVGGTE